MSLPHVNAKFVYMVDQKCTIHKLHLVPYDIGGLCSPHIPMLLDKQGTIAKSYGVFLEDCGVPQQAFFIIDDEQIMSHITITDLPLKNVLGELTRLVLTMKSVSCLLLKSFYFI